MLHNFMKIIRWEIAQHACKSKCNGKNMKKVQYNKYTKIHVR